MKNYVFAFVAFTMSLPGNAATITASPDLASVQLGSKVTVELTVSGVSNFLPPSVSTYRIILNFDGAVLSPSSINFGAQLDLGSASAKSPTFGGNSIVLEEFSFASAADLQNLQTGSFVLGSIVFDSIALGGSPLTLSVDNLLDENGYPLTYNVSNSNVTVVSSQVPEPSFFVPSLLCLGFWCFRENTWLKSK